MGLKQILLDFLASPQFLVWRRIASIVIIVFLTFLIASLVNKLMKRTFRKIVQRRQEHPEIPTDTTKFIVLRRVIQVLIYLMGFAAIVYAIPEFRALSYSILVGAGVAAVIVGFAAQKAFANIMSGIFLAISEPIRVGDRVTINNNYGIIEDITLRHTVIRLWNNDRHIIPNSVMNEAEITNHSIIDDKVIQTMEVGISYDADIDKAKKIIVEEVRKHPSFVTQYDPTGYVKTETAVTVRVMECGEFAVKLKAYFWAPDKLSAFIMEKEVLESVKKRFDKESVEIPFPYRTIVYKTDLENKRKSTRSVKKGSKKK
ncbi:mechanosensitive ion channel family protein [Candidatus Woesearchaeota archaeon]|nr:mechanosensitive ion channel family protein [Candidatus Woesearchaeota archaeon]